MKKSLRTVFLLLFTMTILTVSALADTGPKPQLTVKVKNAPDELYYLDLLATGEWEHEGEEDYSGLSWSYTDEERAALDEDLLAALHAAIPEGWHACTVQGTTHSVPMWGDIVGEVSGEVRLHTFGYHGVPDEYRILVVQKSGEVWVSSETYTRETLQSSVTVDLASGEVTVPSTAKSYALQFLSMLLPTLLIEGVLLLAFGYRSKRSWLVFLAVNLVTQGGFAAYLAVTVLNHGVSGWSLIFFIPIEVVILIVEWVLYYKLLTEKGKERASAYAIAANVCSAVLGLWLVAPVWQWIVSIS